MCKGRSKEASGEAGVEDEKGWVLNALRGAGPAPRE